MKNYARRLKLIGEIWLGLGTIVIVWGALYLFGISWDKMLPFRFSDLATNLFGTLHIQPWTELMAIAIGLLLIVSGWGLVQRYSWTQMLMIVTHLLLTVFALVGWIAVSVLQRNPLTRWPSGPVIFLVVAIVNGGLALFINGMGATEALSWLPLQTVHITPLKCEFCGSALDLQTGTCPECETIPEISPEPQALDLPKARLIGQDGTEFWVTSSQKTFIGRGSTRNDINLSNPTVSRRHAWIEYKKGRFVLNAMSDSNGTFINNALVRRGALSDGDQVRFGRDKFQFLIGKEEGMEL
ncbi:MAG: FHA domain-containing protein [Anaerolineae bacterium]|nr:FHA domain-containing protein [Anaerolineae bacterium]